jgi:hypothetical protein
MNWISMQAYKDKEIWWTSAKYGALDMFGAFSPFLFKFTEHCGWFDKFKV